VAWLVTGRPGIPLAIWGLVALSALGELVYYVLLSAAYRQGEVSQIYPTARGTAPVLAVLAGLALGERLHAAGYVGIVLALAGLVAVRPPRGAGSATVYALGTGVAIAWYSAVDSVGVQHVQPWLYGWAIWTGTALFVAVWPRAARRWSRRSGRHIAMAGSDATPPIGWRQALVLGTMMAVPYLMVLMALSWAPLVVIAPVRESAIVLVTLWGVLRLGERERVGWRLGGAAAVVAAIVLFAA
jgi:uncharacterized membrane protein